MKKTLVAANACLCLFLAIAAGDCPAAEKAAAPVVYQKCDSWQESMRVSRDALAVQAAEVEAKNAAAAKAADPSLAGVEPWLLVKACTDVPATNRPTFDEKVKIRIAGLKNLYLGCQLLDPRGTASLEWNDAVLIDKAGKKIPLASLPPAGWKGNEEKDSIRQDRRQIRLSRNEVGFTLDGNYEWLEGRIHLDLGTGAVAWVNGRSLFAEKLAALEGKRLILSRLDRDFAANEQKRQMQFEERDHLWLKDWVPGDIAELAGRYAEACKTKLREQCRVLAAKAKTAADLAGIRKLYLLDVECHEMQLRLQHIKAEAITMAIEDLTKSFPDKYPHGAEFTRRAADYAAKLAAIREKLEGGDESALKEAEDIFAFQKEALLANPLLGFDKLILVRRKGENNLGLSSNFGPSTNPGGGAEIAVLSPVASNGKVSTLFLDAKGRGVCDVDLDFDAGKMLFTMNDQNGAAQIWEIKADGSGLRQISPSEPANDPARQKCPVHNCDACYLPDGRIIFISTATMTGVPCVGGSIPVGNLYRMDADGTNIMQLTFDQDQNWYPVILSSGRIMYLRWEYTDTAHYFTRLLFTMNPDGTGQSELYGSNSYWPNSTFFARPVPGHPTKVVGVVTGHHGTSRAGELLILDPAKGRREADGVVQRIPGYGQKVNPTIKDKLVDDSWPKFLYPYPLGEADGRGAGKYFLVSCKLTPEAPWGIYLVDIFDNLVPLLVEPGCALLEPMPLLKQPRPPVVPDRIDLKSKEAVIYLQDIYVGPGLAGIPRGTVKNLRVFTYAYNYRGMGSHSLVGQESGWDVKRIMGTVPVGADGSAMFRVPANTPIAIQPLDEEGRALQLMRSWMTARPGEMLSCVGCHETGNSTPLPKKSAAGGQIPDDIKPFYGPVRGFSFEREVQPVLDKRCIACHDGKKRADGRTIPDFANRELKQEGHSVGAFSQSYLALNPYVRRPGPESDYHLQVPMEWHADTSPLVQLLKKGHHNVVIDKEEWDRIYTWIDLNVPYYGTYRESMGRANAWSPHSEQAAARRRELMKRFAHVEIDPEAVAEVPKQDIKPVMPPAETGAQNAEIKLAGWPFDEKAAKKMQADAGKETRKTVTLADGVALNLVLVPAGEFVMGDAAGYPDEWPRSVVKIEKPFWMGEVEISNQLFALFDPQHDSAYQDMAGKDQSARGYPANQPNQPVVRVSCRQAMEFCAWLSARTGKKIGLPTEAQWEWACRGGAELAPASLLGKCNSKWSAAATVGSSAPNPWGLKDMYGNACEWTRTAYRPYPYRDNDGRNDPASTESKVVRGGSWQDTVNRVRAGIRIPYQPYRALHNVGFRVVCEME